MLFHVCVTRETGPEATRCSENVVPVPLPCFYCWPAIPTGPEPFATRWPILHVVFPILFSFRPLLSFAETRKKFQIFKKKKIVKKENRKKFKSHPEDMIQAGHLLLELSYFALGRLALTFHRVQRATKRLTFRFKLSNRKSRKRKWNWKKWNQDKIRRNGDNLERNPHIDRLFNSKLLKNHQFKNKSY